jgi:uncharacterized DUF497 family protein
MNVDWDPNKAKTNRADHGVSFPDAEAVLYDPNGITREDDSAEGEQRFVTVGLDALGRVLVVVYTYRGDTTRIISARKATRNEVRTYERGI